VTRFLLISTSLLAFAAGGQAFAQTNLVTNGDFNQTTSAGGGGYYTGTGTAPSGSNQATGWNACSTQACNTADSNYPFLFIATPGVADGAGTNATNGFADPWDDAAGAGNSSQGIAYRDLWGAANGGVGQDGQVGDAFNGYGPLGAHDPNNFLIADADYHKDAIYQTINNLVVGDHYSVTFDWAAGQWSKNIGATTEQWQVSLGNSTGYTNVVSLNAKSFSGWMPATLNFTATSTSEALSFFALCTPSGMPPMLLLDDVAMFDTPEPAALATMLIGVASIGMLVRRRRRGGATA
jgi:hypothetical protein